MIVCVSETGISLHPYKGWHLSAIQFMLAHLLTAIGTWYIYFFVAKLDCSLCFIKWLNIHLVKNQPLACLLGPLVLRYSVPLSPCFFIGMVHQRPLETKTNMITKLTFWHVTVEKHRWMVECLLRKCKYFPDFSFASMDRCHLASRYLTLTKSTHWLFRAFSLWTTQLPQHSLYSY